VSLFFPNLMFLFGAIGRYLRRAFLALSERPRVSPRLLCPVFLSGLARCRRDTGKRSAPLTGDRGFSMVEVAVVVAITMILAAVSLPWVRGTLQNYGLSSAVATTTGVIQTTRYQAIMKGCAYEVTFNSTNVTYQVASELASPCATTFTNVGSALPVATSGGVTLSATSTLQFNPNGTVQATQGGLSFNLSTAASTETITVSGVGDVSVSP
jgi:Tfp pilus assembly protein FimT